MDLFSGCEFCAQVDRVYTINNRILYQSERLTVWPSLGALGDGHLLVLPNRHRTGFLDFEEDECQEFLGLLQIFKSAFSEKPTTFLIGEHGRQEVEDGDAEESTDIFAPRCVQHAHIHLIAIDCAFEELFQMYVSELGEPSVKFADCDIGGVEKSREGEYILAGNGVGDWYMWRDVPDVQSQLVRRVAAQALGEPKTFNWREFPSYEQMKKVKQRVGPVLLGIEGNMISNMDAQQSEFDLSGKL